MVSRCFIFSGGYYKCCLVSTVKPLSDKERVSHEELAYVVDSTASPIASQLAFNAWPHMFNRLFVSGVAWLATEADRILFSLRVFLFVFMQSLLFWYFFSCHRKPLFLGKKLEKAMHRARQTGALDAPGAQPLGSPEWKKLLCLKGIRACC